MNIKKSNANAFMLAVLFSFVAVVVINVITALIGLPALVMCCAFLLWTAGIAVMVEQRQWVFLIVMCIGMCIIITGISWQAGLHL